MVHKDTIVAPVTPPGEGGVGIVRISGDRAESFLRLFFRPRRKVEEFNTHRLYLGTFVDLNERPVDEVMAVLMKAPSSYTCEDVVEIQCHGGSLLIRTIIDTLVDGGARLAKPGEFTLRAFLNGRLDLSEAEAVIDLIRSRSSLASRVALGQLNGKVSRQVHGYRQQVADLLALVEAYIDFPDEDVDIKDHTQLERQASTLCQSIDEALASFDTGRLLREGLSVLIIGQPNVGKSSLLNFLLGEARAIVTDIPGTTRDTIEEQVVLEGFPLRLVDTAGVRHTDDPVEAEGVARARKKAASADLILLVIDGAKAIDDNDLLAMEACTDGRVIVVRNKADETQDPVAHPFFTSYPLVDVSARTGLGMDQLKELMVQSITGTSGSDAQEDVIFSDRRHREALVRCRCALGNFLQGLSCSEEPEFLSIELRDALEAIGEITGETTPDDILDRIFSRFCIGK